MKRKKKRTQYEYCNDIFSVCLCLYVCVICICMYRCNKLTGLQAFEIIIEKIITRILFRINIREFFFELLFLSLAGWTCDAGYVSRLLPLIGSIFRLAFHHSRYGQYT